MPSVSYPFDTTGLAATNKIVDEVHVLSELNDTTYRIIIPTFSPFYQDNFVLKHSDGLGVMTPLTLGIDYDFCLPYMQASRSIGKVLFGAVTVHTELLQGNLQVTYQTLGGDWIADKSYVLEQLANHLYNPRIAYWDQITNKTNQFPPTNHTVDYDNIYGQQAIIDAINALIAAITTGPTPTNLVFKHLQSQGNVHNLTTAELGLDLVPNIPLATDAEVTDKQSVDKLVTLNQMLNLGLLPAGVNLQPVYTAIQNAMSTTYNSAVQGAINAITVASLGLGNVQNLPVASAGDISTPNSVDKYILLSQALALFETQTAAKKSGFDLNAATYWRVPTSRL